MTRLRKLLLGLKKLENNELLQLIYYQCGSILVIQILKFLIDYIVKPLKNWISSMFPEDWGATK